VDAPNTETLQGHFASSAPDAVLPLGVPGISTNRVPHPCDGPDSESITVLLAEDRELVRGALVNLLSREQDIQVVSARQCDDELTAVALRLRPDVVVVDVDAPVARSLAAVTDLGRHLPACRIVALTPARPAGLVQRLFAAAVLGVIDRNAPAARLLEAIRGAARGELVVDVHLAIAAVVAEPCPLTARELDVLRLAAQGASGPEIAQRLHLSPGTVRNYLSKVIAKTRARTMTDAVRIARDTGWI
jgi:two-component system response regulator DesR